MTDKIIRGRPFQKGNQAAKNRRRRVSYEAIFSDALETDGDLFVEKIKEHRDAEDASLSLKACDIFFKYARPPEKDELPTAPDTSYVRAFGLTLEEGLQVKKELQENQSALVEECIQRVLQAREQKAPLG
jgi:hypothetical protein